MIYEVSGIEVRSRIFPKVMESKQGLKICVLLLTQLSASKKSLRQIFKSLRKQFDLIFHSHDIWTEHEFSTQFGLFGSRYKEPDNELTEQDYSRIINLTSYLYLYPAQIAG